MVYGYGNGLKLHMNINNSQTIFALTLLEAKVSSTASIDTLS